LDGKSGGASGVLASPRSGLGPESRPVIWASVCSVRWWTRPQVQVFGSAPRVLVSVSCVDLTALSSAALSGIRLYSCAFFGGHVGIGPQPSGGQTVDPASITDSRYWPSESFISERSPGTALA